jgi:Bacterial self-protective colicin-like immunity
LTRFLDGSLTAEEVQFIYLPLYLQDDRHWPYSTFLVLDRLFAEIESYSPDADEERDFFEVEEDHLRRTAAELLPELLAENFAHFPW